MRRSPYLFEQAFMGHHPASVIRQRPKQVEFARGEIDPVAFRIR